MYVLCSLYLPNEVADRHLRHEITEIEGASNPRELLAAEPHSLLEFEHLAVVESGLVEVLERLCEEETVVRWC
jgi:hypothetical protein